MVSRMQDIEDMCVVCAGRCRPRQQCLQCDVCDGWQHRTCRTDITQTFYRLLVKGEVTLDNWSCWLCNLKQTSQLTKGIQTTLQEVTSDLLDTDPIASLDSVAIELTATPSPNACEANVDVACPIATHPYAAYDVPECIGNVAAYVDVAESHPQVLPDIQPPRLLRPSSCCSLSSSPSSTVEEDDAEDQISFMYVGDADRLVPKKTTPRSPSMPRLESATPTQFLPLPLSQFVTPSPTIDVSTPRTSSSHAASPSSSEMHLYIPESSFLTPLAPPRHLPSPTSANQPRWSGTTDSPFPSPTDLCRLSTSVDLDTWSPPPTFLSVRTAVGRQDSSALAILEDRLVKELKL